MKGLSFVKKFDGLLDHSSHSTPVEESPSSPNKKGFGSKFDGFGRSISSKMSSISNALGGDDEESSHKAFDKQLEKFREVELLVENFRLQCPQTHAGLVVAFTTTTLSPLVDPNIKFKWYRVEEDIVQIDESARGWYPPTADDIGRKIMAQCQDEFDQGYCRYAEAGPVEADPLLCTMVESSLENGRYELKDVGVSFGVKDRDPSETVISASAAARGGVAACSFNMLSTDRPSALSSNGPFLKIQEHTSVEVTYQGVFISGAVSTGDDMDVSSHRNRKGLQINPSSKLKIYCTLPASLVIVIPLSHAATTPKDETSTTVEGVDVNSVEDSGDKEGDAVGDKVDGKVEDIVLRSKSTDSEAGAAAVIAVSESRSVDTYQWVGDTSGEVNESVMEFIQSLPADATSFRVCLSCPDRMSRDTLALSCRTLVGFDAGVGARDRLSSLPWFSEDGSRRTADVQSIAGRDLVMRLKELEDENATLKRQQYSLNLQIMEHEEESANHAAISMDNFRLARAHSNSSLGGSDEGEHGGDSAGGSEEKTEGEGKTGGDDAAPTSGNFQMQHQQMAQLKAKIREQEQLIAAASHKEIESEKRILEINGKMKRLQTEIEKEKSAANELKQKVTEAHAGEGSMRVLMEKSHEEIENLQTRYDKDMAELKNKIEALTGDLQEKSEKVDAEAAHTLQMRNQLDEKMKEIEELSDRIAALESGSSETEHAREDMESELANKIEELKEAMEKCSALEKRVAELESELKAAVESLEKAEEELSVLRAKEREHESSSVSRDKYEELENAHNTTLGERNHWQKKAESLSKETKRMVKENQHALRGLESDLDSKDTLVARLREQIDMMTRQQEEDERKRQEEEAHKSKGIFNMGKKKKDTA